MPAWGGCPSPPPDRLRRVVRVTLRSLATDTARHVSSSRRFALAGDRLAPSPLTWIAAPESTDPGSGRRVDLAGLVTLALGLTAVVLALVEAEDWSGGAIAALALLGVAFLCLLGPPDRPFRCPRADARRHGPRRAWPHRPHPDRPAQLLRSAARRLPALRHRAGPGLRADVDRGDGGDAGGEGRHRVGCAGDGSERS